MTARGGLRVAVAVLAAFAASCSSQSGQARPFGDAEPLIVANDSTVSVPKVAPGLAASPCVTNADPKLVVVSLSQQFAWMCEGSQQVRTSPVTTGAVDFGLGTPTGTWQVEAKEVDRTLEGPDYSDFVHFWMPFFGDFGIHDASWQVIPFGSQDFVAEGSHGCIHFPDAAMQWLYQWAEVGSTVTITA